MTIRKHLYAALTRAGALRAYRAAERMGRKHHVAIDVKFDWDYSEFEYANLDRLPWVTFGIDGENPYPSCRMRLSESFGSMLRSIHSMVSQGRTPPQKTQPQSPRLNGAANCREARR